jgi:hypothetical protein
MQVIPFSKEKLIRGLLSQKIPDREIARQVGVSTTAVRAIKKAPALRGGRTIPKLRSLVRPRRCNDCGGKVKIWPCLLCHPETADYDLELEQLEKMYASEEENQTVN